VAELAETVKGIIWSASFITYIVVLLFSFAIVLAMTPAIQHWITTPFPDADNPSQMLYPREDIFLITPFYIHLFFLDGTGFQAWHLAILVVLTLGMSQAIYGLWKKWQVHDAARISLTKPDRADSSLEGVAKLFMASIAFSVAYFLLLSMFGVEMNKPDFDELSTSELIYSLFNASVFEELISRVLLIGVPLVVMGIALKWKSPHRKMLGGGLDLTPATFSLITISAIIFALAHAPGWDYWKVPQVLIPGFALGWAFVRYGLHASMLIHFSINCTDFAVEIWPENTPVQAALGLIMLLWIVTGAYFLYYYAKKLNDRLFPKPAPVPQYVPPPQYYYMPPPQYYQPQAYYPPAYYAPPQPQIIRFCLGCGRQLMPDFKVCPDCGKPVPKPEAAKPPAPSPPPQPPPALAPVAPRPAYQGGFVCPNCGHTGATYEPGKLTCLRCGTVFQREKPEPKVPAKEQIEF